MSSDDIDAINSYIVNAAVLTPEAGNLQAQWKTYYSGLGFLDKMSDATLAAASNRRTIFNAANQQPEDIQGAADLTPARMVAKQDAIAQSTGLSPAQKATALAKNPNIPNSHPAITGAAKHATIRLGSKGVDVTAWQNLLGIPASGTFDSATAAATRTWQTGHRLTADGVVGPMTWGAALGAPAAAPAPVAVTTAPVAAPAIPRPVAVAAAATFPPAAAVPTASGSFMKVGIPAAGIAGGWLVGGPIGALVGGVLGLFGASKV
jgi:peptidoglycan hydrolase-like protein with peptidoglycan-binding domain